MRAPTSGGVPEGEAEEAHGVELKNKDTEVAAPCREGVQCSTGCQAPRHWWLGGPTGAQGLR